jgi:hypothetical protein
MQLAKGFEVQYAAGTAIDAICRVATSARSAWMDREQPVAADLHDVGQDASVEAAEALRAVHDCGRINEAQRRPGDRTRGTRHLGQPDRMAR